MKYLIVFIWFIFLFSARLFAQEVPSFEDQEAPVNQEGNIDPASEAAPDSIPTEIDLPASSSPGNSSTGIPPESADPSDFEVFRPSEDISEDLSVPFPADI